MLIEGQAVDDLFAALGGPRKVAREIGAPPTTVEYWKAKRRIPRWRGAAIMELARCQGIIVVTGAPASSAAA